MASREEAAARLTTELAQAESTSGMAVPHELGVLLRNRFGVEPTGIRIHENALPETLGAAALTHGAHIHLAPSACSTTPDVLALLAHELAHVIQQRTGRVPRSTAGVPVLLDDPLLEAEAEALAAFVRSGTPFAPASLAARPLPVDPGPTWVLQPKITVDHQGAPRIYAHTNTPLRAYRYHSVDALWVELVKTQVYRQAQGRVNQGALKEVLKRWCDAPRSPSQVNIVSGYWSESQDKTFSNYEDVATAAIGELLSRDNRQKETRLAQDTYASDYLKGQIRAFIREVLAWHGAQDPRYRQRVGGEHGRYWWYYRPFLLGSSKALHAQSMLSALCYATTHQSPVSEMVSALSDYSLQSRHIYGGQKDTFFRKTDAELKEINKARDTHYNINEGASWSRQARGSQVPTGAGPSATTMNVMALVEAVASAREINAETAARYKEALAWGLFAFWNQTADRLRGEIHTFHEVMTVAARWGVPYAPLAYPDSVPTADKSTVKRHLELNLAVRRRQLIADDED